MEGKGAKKAKEIMNTSFVTVMPDISVEELGRLFIEKDISGVPVVDKEGNLYGVVTANDLIRQERPFHIPTVLHVFDAIISLETDDKVEEEIKAMTAKVAGEICTKPAVTVDEEATIQEIAAIMDNKKIHLIPVTREGRMVGIIGKRDMIRAIAG